ncbi:hypothetical protein KX01_386 [Francisella frigiditurris]|uniref:Uncharacterized protein n=1 Tax=Francisella frigiditurris TaxID=1542390 RepID=A0A1J0KR76_9GAMM|nr:hypothetical protein KX01_386 [Francisella frigiditurris]
MFKMVITILLTLGLVMTIAKSDIKNVNIDNFNIIKL